MKNINVIILIIYLLLQSCNNDIIQNDHKEESDSSLPNDEILIPHPRLLLNAGEENKIKQLISQSTQFTEVHDYILKESDRYFSLPPVEYKLNGKRLLDVSEEVNRRLYYLSYSYRMTGNEDYLNRAEKELLAVSDFKDWNPQHFLDVAVMSIGVSIGYDWLYDKLSDNVKKKIRNAIIEKAILPAANSKYNWFYTSYSNWNQICNAGLVMGALAIYEDQPEMAKETIDKSIKSLNEYGMKVYEPDGAYPEGYTYWGGGTGMQVTMMASLETAMGSDLGLSDNEFFMKSPYFILLLSTPNGFCYNYGDSGSSIRLEQAMFWFAEKLKNPSLLYIEYQHLSDFNRYVKNDGTDRFLPNVLIFSKNLDLGTIKEPNNFFWKSNGVKPIFTYRSGWSNKNDAYLGIVGGAANISHGHMDAGSFLFEKNQVRWAHELGLQSYSTLESKGVDLWNYSQTGQRWDVFRLSNKGHSTLIVNDERHYVDGAPQIIQTFQTDEEKGAEIDLSSLFPNSLNKAVRKVILNKDDDLIITDKITTNSKTDNIRWQMVTQSEAKLEGNKIILTKNGHQMNLFVETNPDLQIKMKIWGNSHVDTDELHEYDHDNPGTCRVGFIIEDVEANSNYQFKVSLVTER